jgi:HTH-type transcriptional regulator/antitoxin HigA
MNIRPIYDSKDHERALARLTTLLESDPAPESDAGTELEVLAALIEQYEAEHFPIESPTPVEAIRFRMDQAGLRNKDLVPFIGSASKVSEVLNGKRPLSLTMIRNLHRHLGIPAEVLVQD